MAGVGLGAMIVGGLLQADTARKQGLEAKKESAVNAVQLEIAANQEKAVAQKKSSEILRQNRLLQSRIIALNAAGGGSSSEKNVSDLLGRTAAEGQYDALNALYEGDIRAKSLSTRASNVLREGKSAYKSSKMNAISSLINTGSQVGTFYSKYNNPAPNYSTSYPNF